MMWINIFFLKMCINLFQISFIMKEMEEFNICIPFPQPKPSKDVKYGFSYIKPTSITVIGSFSLGTSIKKDTLNIDLAVEIPEVIFSNF